MAGASQGAECREQFGLLNKLNAIAADLKPAGTADDIRQAMLSLSLMRLSDAREQRLMAADTTVPAVVWIVTLMGGALTVVFASLLGVQPRHASGDVGGNGDFRSAGADHDHRAQQPFRGDFRVSAEPFEQVIAQVEPRSEIPWRHSRRGAIFPGCMRPRH